MDMNEYFRFSRKSITWNGEILLAEPLNYSEDHLKIQREWWYGEPLSVPIPQLQFAVREDAPMPDNYLNATLFDIYSPRLVAILQNAGVAHDLYPVELVGKNTGMTLSTEYKVFRLLEIDDVLNREASVFRDENHRGKTISYIEKPVYKEEFLRLQKPLTRIKGFASIVIIQASLLSLLEKEGISGCRYSPFPKIQ